MRNQWNSLEPVSADKTLSILNNFLEDLNNNGVKLVSIFDLEVDLGYRPGAVNNVTEVKKVAIVHKA